MYLEKSQKMQIFDQVSPSVAFGQLTFQRDTLTAYVTVNFPISIVCPALVSIQHPTGQAHIRDVKKYKFLKVEVQTHHISIVHIFNYEFDV